MGKKSRKTPEQIRAEKQAKKARNRENKRAREARENSKAAVAVVEPEPVVEEKQVVRLSAQIIALIADYASEFKGAVRCALNDEVEDSRDFLVAAKAARKDVNKLIADPARKLRRTAIKKLEDALTEHEREAELKERQDALKPKAEKKKIKPVAKAEPTINLVQMRKQLVDGFFLVYGRDHLYCGKKNRKAIAAARNFLRQFQGISELEAKVDELYKLTTGYFRRQPGSGNKCVFVSWTKARVTRLRKQAAA